MMRPMGVVSKNDMGDPTTASSARLNNSNDARKPMYEKVIEAAKIAKACPTPKPLQEANVRRCRVPSERYNTK